MLGAEQKLSSAASSVNNTTRSEKYTQYGQTVRQRYDANNLLPRQFVMKESRNQKGCHWGYKQDEEEIEKC